MWHAIIPNPAEMQISTAFVYSNSCKWPSEALWPLALGFQGKYGPIIILDLESKMMYGPIFHSGIKDKVLWIHLCFVISGKVRIGLIFVLGSQKRYGAI